MSLLIEAFRKFDNPLIDSSRELANISSKEIMLHCYKICEWCRRNKEKPVFKYLSFNNGGLNGNQQNRKSLYAGVRKNNLALYHS